MTHLQDKPLEPPVEDLYIDHVEDEYLDIDLWRDESNEREEMRKAWN